MKFKPDENLPVSATAILAGAGHDVDTVTHEGLIGAPDRDVVAAATAAGPILISLDRGLGDIRAYPPGSYADIVVLRLTSLLRTQGRPGCTPSGCRRLRGKCPPSSASP